ncbi:MAG: class I SAM-dependent methyltransferase [Enhygromyxa sp.]
MSTTTRLPLSLQTIVERKAPRAWSRGYKLPWADCEFSERMLEQHLSQEHDAASRRFEKIDAHVDWLHRSLLRSRPSKILDVCCGPGLYSNRLAALGHECVGIDYGPASIRWAEQQAESSDTPATFVLSDVSRGRLPRKQDLAILLYGELNSFPPAAARKLLRRIKGALKPGGRLVLEVHAFATVEQQGQEPRSWSTQQSGLMAPTPHLLLSEHFWDAVQEAATSRYYVIDAETSRVDEIRTTLQAYSRDAYRGMLIDAGFEKVRFRKALGSKELIEPGFEVIVAQRL